MTAAPTRRSDTATGTGWVAWRCGDRRPGTALRAAHHRPGHRRRGPGRGHPGPPARRATRPGARCSTCTASSTTSSRPIWPTSSSSAAGTSTPSTCANTAAACCRTRRPNFARSLTEYYPRAGRGGPDHPRAGRPRPAAGRRPLHRRPDHVAVGALPAGPGPGRRPVPEQPVLRLQRARGWCKRAADAAVIAASSRPRPRTGGSRRPSSACTAQSLHTRAPWRVDLRPGLEAGRSASR